MDVANNLNIESLQDSNSYDNKSGSASLSGIAGATGVSASVSVSGTKMKSRFASVNEQSGISAGRGGYDITVGNNTDLKGAVIASTATDTASNNLDTGTISFSEVKNSGYYDVDSMSFSASMSTSSLMPTVSAPSAYHNGDDKSSTTQSAIANGNLTVRNKDAQKQAVDTLSHDTANANSQLQAFFDKDKEQDRMDTVQMVKDVATQVKTVGTKLDRLTAQKEVDKKGISEDAYNAAKNTLGANATEKQIKALAYSNAVDTAVIDATKNGNNIAGIGSGFNKAVDSGASLVTGAITGDVIGGLAGASAPYLAGVIKNSTPEDSVERYVAHGILGGGVAALQGNSALAGAAGAAGGEYAANTIRDNFYDGKDTKDLTESEKQDISNLSQIASGLAVGAASGGNMGDASTAISASKNSVENNYLGEALVKAAEAKCDGNKDCEQQTINEGINGYNDTVTKGMAIQSAILANAILPESAVIGATLSGIINTGTQYMLNDDGNINWTDVGIASGVGAVTGGAGTGFWGTVAWNGVGGATSNYLDNKDPLVGAGISAISSSFGYLGGKSLESSLNKVFNPVSKQYQWVPIGILGISKPSPQSSIPAWVGAGADSSLGEFIGYQGKNYLESK